LSDMYIEEIRRFLPHRYPFLLVDRVLECTPGESITAIKNVSVNVGVDGVRFKRQVVPGDQLILKATIERRSKVIWKFSCEASVNGELCTAAKLLCAASPKDE